MQTTWSRPITRTVSDAVHVLEAIVGYDARDAEATHKASQYIPEGGYRQFLNIDGLRGKRLGILRKDFFRFPSGSVQEKVFSEHFDIMRYFASISSWNYLGVTPVFLNIFPVSVWQCALILLFKWYLSIWNIKQSCCCGGKSYRWLRLIQGKK